MARGTGILAQLRVIAAAVEVLPEVRDHLANLDTRLLDMTDEVRRMRAGVDALGEKVDRLNGAVDGLDDHFDGLRSDVGGLDGHLTEVRAALGPLEQTLGGVGRLTDRLRGR